MGRMGAGSQSLNDGGLIRGVGLVALGGDGLTSALLGQVTLLLPFGGAAVRLAVVSAIGLGAASALGFWLLAHLLGKLSPQRVWWTSLLAFLGTMLWALGPIAQGEAIRPGGKTIAAALLLGCAAVAVDWDRGSDFGAEEGAARRGRAVRAAILGGLLAMESPVVAVVFAVVVAAAGIRNGRPGVVLRSGVLDSLGGVGVVLAVAAVWWGSPRTEVLGMSRGVSDTLSALVAAGSPFLVGSSWIGQLGVVIVVLGGVGLVFGVAEGSTRVVALVLGALLLADAAFGRHDPIDRGSDPFAIPCEFIFCALSVLALVGCGRWLSRFSRRMAPYGMVLGGVLLAVLAATRNDDAGYASEHQDSLGMDVWTEEAVVELPPGTTLVVRDEAVFRRVWLSQVTRGERPDVLLVPLFLGNQPEFASQLLVKEPAVLPVLRDMAVGGTLSEYSLSQLADARPVFVQLGRGMGGRLREHLLPRSLWSEVVAHNVARSDRLSAVASSRGPVERIMSYVDPQSHADRQVAAMVKTALREQVVVVLALGERDLARPLLEQYAMVDGGDAWLAHVKRALMVQARGPVAIDAPEAATEARGGG